MTKTQFYKIRPKPPKISKADPRRLLSQKFVAAYNSCDFDTIWEFVSTNSMKDVLFVNRWVGEDHYLNFPSYLEVRGIENVAEYWFSRCVITPDLVFELKETKLYVRSDGLSTIRSAFQAYCTRLYDGVICDSLICEPALHPVEEESSPSVKESTTIIKDELKSEGDTNNSNNNNNNNNSNNNNVHNPDALHDRVMGKFVKILLYSEPLPQRKKRTISGEEQAQPQSDQQQQLSTQPQSDSCNSTVVSSNCDSHKKLLPRGTSITLVGTITLQLNQEQKVKQYEVSFALKK
jgi:hypothetical protein